MGTSIGVEGRRPRQSQSSAKWSPSSCRQSRNLASSHAEGGKLPGPCEGVCRAAEKRQGFGEEGKPAGRRTRQVLRIHLLLDPRDDDVEHLAQRRRLARKPRTRLPPWTCRARGCCTSPSRRPLPRNDLLCRSPTMVASRYHDTSARRRTPSQQPSSPHSMDTNRSAARLAASMGSRARSNPGGLFAIPVSPSTRRERETGRRPSRSPLAPAHSNT